MKSYDFVVVGAGNAGRTAVETLVENSPASSVLLVDAEEPLPYKRTRVSKKVATGFECEDFAIHEEGWYLENSVDLIRNAEASSLDTGKMTIGIGDDKFGYGALLLATGAKPRIPFTETSKERYSTLWSVSDGRELHRRLHGCRKAVVIGMGVLGVEAAWQIAQTGTEVTITGSSEQPMKRYLDAGTARLLSDSMTRSGVEILPGRTARGVSSEGDRLRVHTDEGSLDADCIVLATGSDPEITLAKNAGIRTRRGVLVDESLAASVSGVWAAGDCAEHPDGTVTGLWHSAEHQGRLAAESMLGRKVINTNPPYRLKCEVFGGLWFSGGPVTAPVGPGEPEAAETWISGDKLWRPRFLDSKLQALSAAAPSGMDKSTVKLAQKLLLDAADRETVRSMLIDTWNTADLT